MIKEIALISGKGGTGKTSLAGSFAAMATDAVLVDSDVDAANLHLILEAQQKEAHEFKASHKAVIDDALCTQCGRCLEVCRFDALSAEPRVNPLFCEGCGVCSHACPESAISMQEIVSGHWFVSDTPYGPLVHARLGIAEGNSGRLITLLRNKARDIAQEHSKKLIIIDGPPGIGCPVISTISGLSTALIVTEPSFAAISDMLRVLEVCRCFDVPAAVCINRFDLDLHHTRTIEDFCHQQSIPLVGKIPFERTVAEALVNKRPAVTCLQNDATQIIREIWPRLLSLL